MLLFRSAIIRYNTCNKTNSKKSYLILHQFINAYFYNN